MKKAVIIILAIFTVSTFADWRRDPASDVDKEFLSGNEYLIIGVPPNPDNSCWLASASNMLAGAGYGTGGNVQERAEDIYVDLLRWQFSLDPLNVHGTADGGWIDTALTWWLGSANNTWPSNPYTIVNVYGNKVKTPYTNPSLPRTIGNKLRDYELVGLSISKPRVTAGGSPSGGHAVTAWGDDETSFALRRNPDEVMIGDSDRDEGGDYQSYSYDDYTNPNPDGFNEGDGWYINFAANHWFIKHIATLSPADSPVDPSDGPTQLVMGSYKIKQDDLEYATDLHYTTWTDYNILSYRTEIDWPTENAPIITESDTHIPSLERSDITADWNLTDNPVPYGKDVTITTEFVLQGWNGVWFDDVYFQYPGGQQTKYIQPPYNSPNGTDIRVDNFDGIDRLIADDFECTQRGPITQVYLWGSWDKDLGKGEKPGNIENFALYIYSDDPIGDDPDNKDDDPDNTESKPLSLLWSGNFDEFQESDFSEVPEEYFWDPFTEDLLSWDNRIWQYIIEIPEDLAFYQQGTKNSPMVYWLGVSAQVKGETEPKFGWKTTAPENGWNDKAVAWKDTFIKTDEFDYWEDQTSHGFTAYGSISEGAYDCNGDRTLCIGDKDSGSYASIFATVSSGTDKVKLRYQIPWIGGAASGNTAKLYVDGGHKTYLTSTQCDWQEVVLDGMSYDTADGIIEIIIADEFDDYDGNVQICNIEVYSIGKGWASLNHPSGHELADTPIDLAFAVVTPKSEPGRFRPEFGWNILTEELEGPPVPDICGGYVIGTLDLYDITDDRTMGEYRFVHQYPYTQDPEQHTFTIQSSPDGNSDPCADFEDVKSPSNYPVSNFLNTQGYDITFKEFYWLPSGSTSSGLATVDTTNLAGGTGAELELNNINAVFSFNYPIQCLRLNFGEYGGNINLEINDDFKNFRNFAEIDGWTIGGCTISVVNGLGDDQGTLSIQGPIASFKIGGQELYIDDICPSCGDITRNIVAQNLKFGHSYGLPSKEELWSFSDWMTSIPQQISLNSGEQETFQIDWEGRLTYPESDITPAHLLPNSPACTTFLEGDINKDCSVNLLDLKIIASNWLDSSFTN